MSDAMKLNIGAALEAERQWRDTRSKSKARRVKIEKVNQAWLVRFLPVSLGKSGLFYVRQGQHWLNKSPVFCPRDVSPDYGGDPDAECPVCRMSEDLNAMDNEEISKFGFRLRSNITYITYCLVYEIDYGRGDSEQMGPAEILKPWEFQHYQSSFDELTDYFRRGASAKRPWSVLDTSRGNDFWATKTPKGIRLDRQDPGSILTVDEHFEANLDAIFAAVQQPRIKLQTLKDLEVFARKAEDAAYGDGGSSSNSGNSGGRDDDRGHRGSSRRGRADEDEAQDERSDDRPSSRLGRSAAPTSRHSARPAAEDQPAGEEEAGEEQNSDAPTAEEGSEDQVPGAEVPARRTAPAATARPATTNRPATTRPATTAAPAKPATTAARPATTARPTATAPVAATPARTQASAARPTATVRPAAVPARPATTTARPASARPTGAVATAPVRRPATAPARAAAEQNVSEEEDQGVAEEANDQAPPGEELPPEESQQEEGAQDGEPEVAEGQEEAQVAEGQEEDQVAEGQEEDQGGEEQQDEEAPPAPARATAGSLRSRLTNKLKSR